MGGNSGIGRAAARRQPEGAPVVEDIETAWDEALFVRTDVAKEDDIERMVQITLRAYGGLDIAFNNAGADSMGGVSKSTAVT
jgi:NAD(P)-dependent dehydrogenase (short-subunit alcohol dehydrogenase family)